jgi:hypothetical protein
MKKKVFTIALLSLVISGTSLQAKTVEVPVSQLAVIGPPQGDRDPALGPRLCLKFDLPQELRTTEIGYAEIALDFGLPSLTGDSLAVFECFALGSAWSEGDAWGDFPAPGGDLDSSLYSSATTRCGQGEGISVDITEMARTWNARPETNFGAILLPRGTDWNALREIRLVPDQIRNRITLRLVVPGRATP